MTRSCPRTRYVRAWWRQSLVRAWRSWTAITTSRSSARVSWLDSLRRSWPDCARTINRPIKPGTRSRWAGRAEPHTNPEPRSVAGSNFDDATKRVDPVCQSAKASARAPSARTATVVTDLERSAAVASVERDAAGTRAAVLDYVRHRLAERPGDGGLVCRLDARAASVHANHDSGRMERRLGRVEF